jgi:DNA-binding GntR family transcriptional regulator
VRVSARRLSESSQGRRVPFRAVVAELHADELRELHPAELILVCAGVRHAPSYDGATLARLRAANERLRGAGDDPQAAASAEGEFHRRLAEPCGEGPILAVLERVRDELTPYRRAYLGGDDERVARSAAAHDRVIGALADGDRGAAEARLRRHLASSFGELAAELDR